MTVHTEWLRVILSTTSRKLRVKKWHNFGGFCVALLPLLLQVPIIGDVFFDMAYPLSHILLFQCTAIAPLPLDPIAFVSNGGKFSCKYKNEVGVCDYDTV